jgi:WD40 repeat protein
MSRTRAAALLTAFLGLGVLAAVRGEPPSAEEQRGPARSDRHGDPLPPGALARLGTVRLRHPGAVWSVAFTPDGKTAIAGCTANETPQENRTIRLWDVATGKLVRALDLPQGTESLAVSRDGRTLAAQAGAKSCVRLWDLATGQPIYRLPEGGDRDILAVAFAPDGKTLATTELRSEIEVWDARGGRSLYRLGKVATRAVYAPDGNRLATLQAGEVALWDVAADEAAWSLSLPVDESSPLAVSGGKCLAVGAADGTVRLLDLDSGRERRRLRHENVHAVALSPDGDVLATGDDDGLIRLWDPAAGTGLRELHGHVRGVTSLAFAPDGKTLLSGSLDQTVRLWDVATGRERLPFVGPQGSVDALAFSPDGTTLASGGGDDSVRLWHPATGQERWHVTGHRGPVSALAFSPDGTTLASASWDRTVRLCDAATGRERRRLEGHGNRVYAVAISPDGRLLASASIDSSLRLWDVASGRPERRLDGGTVGKWVTSLTFTPDGKGLVSGREDGSARLCAVADGREVRQFAGHAKPVQSVALSPDGRVLATAGADGTIALWDVGSGREHRRLTGHEGEVNAVAFGPDGRTLVSGGADHTVRIWEAASGREVRCFRGHEAAVKGVAFAPDGRRLASGGGDFTILLWDATGLGSADGRLSGRDLTEEELMKAWWDLAGADAAAADRAVWQLTAAGDRAVRFLGARLAPVPVDVQERIAHRVADLDAEDFGTREKATRELEGYGPLAEATLRRARRESPSPEVRKRGSTLLERLGSPDLPPLQLREVRALSVLGQSGTAEARRVLRALASGAPEARLTQDAKASLDRLARRRQSAP